MIGDIESATEAWLQNKWGKFSASQIFHLMTPGKGNEIFSPGGITYIEHVAREAYTLFNNEESVESFAMKMGKVREPQSFAFLRRLIGFDKMEYYGGSNPLFQEYCPDSGASPDCLALLPDGNASFGAELKNPTGKTHMHYLRTLKDQFDLLKQSEEYYAQVQFNLMVFKCDLWLWSSHNEYFPFKDRMLILECKSDKNYQRNLDIRLKMAVKKKYQIIEELKNR